MQERKQSDVDGELQQRLQVILKHRSRTDVARLTGTLLSNVSRYAAGTRMPTAFSVALVRGLGVNPVWWLTGEGVPFVGDVADGAANLTGNLLEVVQALNVVGQMRIGSLTGKHHLRMLRELGDAMTRYDELRERLNQHSAPILRAVLHDLRQALDKPDLELARDLCRTSQQLGRLCDDQELSFELLLLQARLSLAEWNQLEALALTRKAIVFAMNRGGMLEARELEVIVESAHALYYMGRNDEVRRIAKAVNALASEDALQTQAGYWLAALVASTKVHVGELHDGIRELVRVSGLLEGLRRQRIDGFLAQALLFAGNIDVATAITFGHEDADKAILILGFAAFQEDASQLALAKANADRVLGVNEDERRRAFDMELRILRGEGAEVADDVKRFATAERSPGRRHYSVLATQLYRLMGKTAQGRRCFRKSLKDIASMPDWHRLGFMWTGRHLRNALVYGDESQKQEAREWFQGYVDRGYRCFAHLLQ